MTKLGGKSPVRVFVKAGDDVVDSLFSMQEGGKKSSLGLRDVVAREHNGVYEVELIREPPERCDALLDDLECASARSPGSETDAPPPPSTRLLAAEPDVVVLSLSADLATPVEKFRESMPRVVRLLKEATDARILFYNCSSVDPNEKTSNYHVTPKPPSLQAHRLNHRLLELSVQEGISIVDADRVIAELGAQQHVHGGLLGYSGEACESLCRECARVLADYGFFEPRPILLQVGARRESA